MSFKGKQNFKTFASLLFALFLSPFKGPTLVNLREGVWLSRGQASGAWLGAENMASKRGFQGMGFRFWSWAVEMGEAYGHASGCSSMHRL